MSNDNLRKKTKLVDVADQIQTLIWNWARHFARHDKGKQRWPSIIEEWIPSYGKKRGAPKNEMD